MMTFQILDLSSLTPFSFRRIIIETIVKPRLRLGSASSAVYHANLTEQTKTRLERIRMALSLPYCQQHIAIYFLAKCAMIEFPFPDVDDWMLLKQIEDEYEKHGVIKISCDEKIYYQIPY